MHVGPTFEAVRQVIKADVFTSGHRPPTMSMVSSGYSLALARSCSRSSRISLNPLFCLCFFPSRLLQEDWGDIVTEKRIARESREALQTAGRVKTLAELAEYGALYIIFINLIPTMVYCCD